MIYILNYIAHLPNNSLYIYRNIYICYVCSSCMYYCYKYARGTLEYCISISVIKNNTKYYITNGINKNGVYLFSVNSQTCAIVITTHTPKYISINLCVGVYIYIYIQLSRSRIRQGSFLKTKPQKQ